MQALGKQTLAKNAQRFPTAVASRSSVRAMASKAHVCEPKWWTADDVAVVTGANKGLGFECARQLAGEAGFTTIVTARNGDQACLDFHQLDIADKKSIEAFKAWLQQKYGKLNVLVNNAAIAYKGSIFGPQEARITTDINYHGTADVTEALLPLMPTDGRSRVVTVASRAGLSSILKSQELKDRFMNAKGRADVDALVDEWLASVEKGDFSSKGWPGSMYGVSKLAVNAYHKALAKDLESKRIMVNTCCPGYCATDMSSHRGTSTAYDGARIFTWLATKPPQDFESGGFWVYDNTGVKWPM
ncbi:short chain dehydrogenase/reductase [Dunaliella salina]|uniref:Short chain dehydrogenase/reductase n=1 Tax=Dunaliella salina TaxID=3046 RepID=A0ABQ7FYN4_DUNSA|nr:short chain dehydrogenase/reductase [Dunaliella salina]|eukprot:KAF5827463.1 short chain dehydrogenase/reductase [Dunaliella salina]